MIFITALVQIFISLKKLSEWSEIELSSLTIVIPELYYWV